MGYVAHFLLVPYNVAKHTTPNILPDHVRAAIDQACLDAGVVCVGIDVRGQDRQLKLEVAVDAPEGIVHENCRAVSKAIDAVLAEDEWYGRLRAVDVSSPGAEAPVRFLWQLKKHVGRTVECTCTDGTVVEGTLMEVDDDHVVVAPAKSNKPRSEAPVQQTIMAGSVKEIRVVIRFKQ